MFKMRVQETGAHWRNLIARFGSQGAPLAPKTKTGALDIRLTERLGFYTSMRSLWTETGTSHCFTAISRWFRLQSACVAGARRGRTRPWLSPTSMSRSLSSVLTIVAITDLSLDGCSASGEGSNQARSQVLWPPTCLPPSSPNLPF
jgi:hypothetical protein